MDILGTVGGVTVGTHGGTDLLSQIVLGPVSDLDRSTRFRRSICPTASAGSSTPIRKAIANSAPKNPARRRANRSARRHRQIIATTQERMLRDTPSSITHPELRRPRTSTPAQYFDSEGEVGCSRRRDSPTTRFTNRCELGPTIRVIRFLQLHRRRKSQAMCSRMVPPIGVLPDEPRRSGNVRDGKRTPTISQSLGSRMLLYDADAPVLDSDGNQLQPTPIRGLLQFTNWNRASYSVRQFSGRFHSTASIRRQPRGWRREQP